MRNVSIVVNCDFGVWCEYKFVCFCLIVSLEQWSGKVSWHASLVLWYEWFSSIPASAQFFKNESKSRHHLTPGSMVIIIRIFINELTQLIEVRLIIVQEGLYLKKKASTLTTATASMKLRLCSQRQKHYRNYLFSFFMWCLSFVIYLLQST